MQNDILSNVVNGLVGIIDCLPSGIGLFIFLPLVIFVIIAILKKVFA